MISGLELRILVCVETKNLWFTGLHFTSKFYCRHKIRMDLEGVLIAGHVCCFHGNENLL